MKLTPANIDSIIDILVDKYPNTLPKEETTLEEIHIKIGQQQVIRYLSEVLETLERKKEWIK